LKREIEFHPPARAAFDSGIASIDLLPSFWVSAAIGLDMPQP
jgi:hypothetical protein